MLPEPALSDHGRMAINGISGPPGRWWLKVASHQLLKDLKPSEKRLYGLLILGRVRRNWLRGEQVTDQAELIVDCDRRLVDVIRSNDR
jgi:hypothetical protein